MKPRLLDLFCGAGGAAVGYARAGFEVVGVDIEPQPNYPFEFVLSDALDVLRADLPLDAYGFDAIHASPPCQGYHSLGSGPQLIAEARKRLEATGLPYVIENIPEAAWALRDPIMVCGTMFDPILGVRRHRLFEANWNLQSPMWPCRHKLSAPRFEVYEHGRWHLRRFAAVYGHGGGKANAHGPEAMGIDWMTRAELVEAIPPAYTEFIGLQLMQAVGSAKEEETQTEAA
jgi:DNA (cytosine-5)-methyltransferase 1